MTLELHRYIVDRATALKEQGDGAPFSTINDELGFGHALSSDAIRKWYGRELRAEDEYHRAEYDDLWRVSKGLVVQSSPEVVAAMESSGVNISSKIVQRPDTQDPIELGAHVFELMKEQQRHKIASSRAPEGQVRVQIKSNVPILFVPFSDWHLGSAGTDYLQLEKHIDLIAGLEGTIATFGGDGVDNFVKHSSAMISADSTPAQQYAILEYLLEKLRPTAAVTGNHDWWTKSFAGIDYLKEMLRRLDIAYAKHRLRLILEINAIEYRIEHRHQYRYKSSINLSNQLQRMWEKSDWEWDIGVVGHTHDGPFHFPFERHSVERYGAVCGAYKVDDDYARQFGFNGAEPNSPCFVLDNRVRHIEGFNSIEAGVEHIMSIRTYRAPEMAPNQCDR